MRAARSGALAAALLWAAPGWPEAGARPGADAGVPAPGAAPGRAARPAAGGPNPRRFNPVPGGWARYLVDSQVGPQILITRVGNPEKIDGEAGRWLRTEFEIPEVGRAGIEMFVVGPTLEYKSLRKVRAFGPWADSAQAHASVDRALKTPDLPQATLTRRSTQQIAGRTIAVEEYELDDGSYMAWSPDVPGTGIVRLSGIKQMMLVAFGVGGDPWAGAAQDLAGPRFRVPGKP